MVSEAVQRFVEQRFSRGHGASISPDYDRWHIVGEAPDCASAVVGHRLASEGPLFLEIYLDEPVETQIGRYFGGPINRSEIVEFGCLASQSATALLSLWAEVSQEIGARYPIAVATLTAPLRNTLGRIGIELAEIAPAHKHRLGEEADRWGSYYASDPWVCAGLTAQAAAAITDYARSRGIWR